MSKMKKNLNGDLNDKQVVKGYDHEFANEPLTAAEKLNNKKTKKRQQNLLVSHYSGEVELVILEKLIYNRLFLSIMIRNEKMVICFIKSQWIGQNPLKQYKFIYCHTL